MGIMESVKKGFSVAGQSLNLVFVLFGFGLVWNIVNLVLTPRLAVSPDTPPSAGASAAMIAVGILFILVSFFVQAGSLGYIADKIKTGKAELSAFFAAGGKFYVKMLLLGLFVGLVVGVLLLAIGLLVALLAPTVQILAVILGLLIGAAVIYFILMVFLAPYAIVVDNEKVMASVKKSMGIVKSHLLTVIGIALVLILIGFLIGVLLGVILAILSAAVKGTAAQVVFAVLSSFVNAYLGVLVSAAFMNLYLSASHNTSGAR